MSIGRTRPGHGGDVLCVYLLVDAETGATRYVGLSVDPMRRLYQHLGVALQWPEHHPEFAAWLTDCLRSGRWPALEVVEFAHGKREGLAAGRRWIDRCQAEGDQLFNRPRYRPSPASPATRAKIAEAQRRSWKEGRRQAAPRSAATREKMRLAALARTPRVGWHHSDETKAKIAASMRAARAARGD